MKVWLCDKCGCEIQGSKKPSACPLCQRNISDFIEIEKKDPSKEDKEMTKKYEEVIDTLDKYTKDCEPEKVVYSVED